MYLNIMYLDVKLYHCGRADDSGYPNRAGRARLLEEGGPRMWEAFMAELRESHLGVPRPRSQGDEATVAATLQAAYEAVVAREAKAARRTASRSVTGKARASRRR
jgi:hypothetical protein